MIRSYTFDNFYTYKGNEVAFLAAKKIVELPGEVFNPFYVYGDDGLGKTHLLNAINHVLRKRYATLLLSVREFERRIETNASFDSPVIVDDIHLIHDDYLDKMQEIMERAVASDIQICLSSVAAPRAAEKFSAKFCSLMESGLVCNVCPPEKAARLEIIMKKAEEAGTILTDDVAAAFADAPAGSIKTIEDMIDRLVAYASLGDLPSDIDRVQLIIKEFFPKERSCVSRAVLADTTREDLGELVSKDRAGLQEEYERKTHIWETKGFNVALLKKSAASDEPSLRDAYDDYMKRIHRLFHFQRAFQNIDREKHPVEAMQIESMLFDPDKLSEIEKIIASLDQIPKPSKSYRKFSDFIVGSCNREARCVYQDKVVSDLGKHNPLIIIGAAGTGKTHFLEAVCDDLLSRGKAVLFHDLAFSEKLGPDADREKYDCLVLDNFQAILDDHGYLRDVLAVIDSFMQADKQVFIGSIPPPEQSPFPADAQEIFDRGLSVELGRPSVDVAGGYIRARMPEQTDDMIEQGIPEFASFYEIEYYLDSYAKDENVIVPLGLPGEHVAQPEAAAPPISDLSISEDAAGELSKKGRADSTPDLNYMIPDAQDELIDERF
jgi:chromosomal replication initiation ATPase DnaA